MTDPLSLWLDARRRLAEMATEGPWYAAEITKDGRTVVDDGRSSWANDVRCETFDAAFIADARTSLPVALRIIECQRRALEHAKECLDAGAIVDIVEIGIALRRVEEIAEGKP